MSPSQVINFFGSQLAIVKTLGVSQPAVSKMVSTEKIPKFQQIVLHGASLGYLEPDAEIMDLIITSRNHMVS